MRIEQPAQKESPSEINWASPNIHSEMGEMERIAEMISGSEDPLDKNLQKTLQQIMEAIGTARMEELTDDIWSELENTDSYHHVRPGYTEDAQKIAKGYNRDPQELLDRIYRGDPLDAPIILILEDGTPHLVAGNTRLMIARALGAKVQALIARLPQTSDQTE